MVAIKKGLVDQHGNPLLSSQDQALRNEIRSLRQQIIKAKYDSAQTFTGNENHWAQADNLDPNSANSLTVRRKLRSRSRYETIENNPYLKGVLLTLVGDTVKTGPTLKITDPRLSKTQKKTIERRWRNWFKAIKGRKKLWRLALAKRVDGEGFAFGYQDLRNRDRVKLNFFCVEADRVSSETMFPEVKPKDNVNEVDGVRFDEYDVPLEYHLLNLHPGGSALYNFFASKVGGDWIDSKFVVHWFRQDRGWLRGIPETTASLPLCAILRRYTLAVLRAAETAADFSAVIESEGPPNMNAWTDGNGNPLVDDPFDVFPIEYGMITSLPWGTTLKQMRAEQPGAMFDKFVDIILREILRPLLVPFNVGSGTSSGSNMASAVVDEHLYQDGIKEERTTAEEDVLDTMTELWWDEAKLLPGYLDEELSPEKSMFVNNPSLREFIPEHEYRWPKVGLDHTDPLKVAKAIVEQRGDGIMTDRDIQETYFNRDVDDWAEEVQEGLEIRERLGLPTGTQAAPSVSSVPDEESEE